MKMKRLKNLRPFAFAALGVFLGRGAQADTVLDFDVRPSGQVNNAQIIQTFGDAAAVSSEGVTVTGFGTPNINLTWPSSGAVRWDYYIDSVWNAGQLNASTVGSFHELVFSPNSPSAAAVIKSFNFHPYYADSAERYAYNVTVVTNSAVAWGPVNYNFVDSGSKVPVSINYTGSIGQTLTLRLARVASSPGVGEAEGGSGNIATDDINFAQLPETEFAIGPQVLTVSPANNQTGVAPDYLYVATITNGVTALKTNTIQLKHSVAGIVSPTIVSNDGLATVSYALAALLPAGSVNKYTLTYSDDGAPAKSFTNEVQYTVVNYVDIQLPAPIAFENFNSTPEGSLPAGWTATNLDTQRDPTSEPNITVTNLDSAAFTNWTVVEASRFTGTFDTYSSLYNGLTQPAGYAEDYQRVLSVNPSNVVNGVFQRSLATGGLAFGNSGYRNDALGQILYLSSPDFDCSGKANVYLSFHSLWEQNQDSIAAVEYSINQGATWLPVVYMINGPDVATNLDGSIDALTTFTNIDASGAAYWFDGSVTNGGYYGAFIGVAANQWSTLAPYISKRVDDNPVESKRVEIFRLPQADNQPKVRLRFAHAGTDSWYFGVDDFGLYSLPPLQITSIVASGGNVTVSWNGAAGTKLQKATSLSSPVWVDVPGSNGASSTTQAVAGGQAYYRLARPY